MLSVSPTDQDLSNDTHFVAILILCPCPFNSRYPQYTNYK